ALRDLPEIRVLQRAAADLADGPRHDAALHHFEDDVALARAAVALPHAGVIAAAEAREPSRQILNPAHASDVAGESRRAVSDDVEAGALVISDERPDGVDVLFAETCVGDGVAERALSDLLGVPRWPRQRSRDRRRQREGVGRLGHVSAASHEGLSVRDT